MPVEINMVQRLTSPNPFALVSTRKEDGTTNLAAVSWWTFASNHQPAVAVCLSKKGYSGERIAATGEFGLNIVSAELAQSAFRCGTCSGRSVDKAREFGIPLIEAGAISTQLIAASRAAMECRLINTVDVFDHVIYIAEVVETHCNPDRRALYAFDGYGRLDTVR